MPKPTLLQSLLKQPTQSYLNTNNGNAQQRRYNYHSVRYDMVRAAEKKLNSSIPIPSLLSHKHPSLLPSPPHQPADDDDDEDQDEDQDAFFTPTASPRHSYYLDDKAVVTPMGAPQQPTLLQSPPMDKETIIDTAKHNDIDTVVKHPASDTSNDIDNKQSPNNDDNDVTTALPPENVRRASTNSSSEDASESASASSPEDSATTCASVSEASSPTSSSSVSASAPSTSIRATATTPATSDTSSMRTVSSRSNDSLRRKKTENKESMAVTYANDDWAKDVRWLVAPTQTSDSDKRKTWHPARAATTTAVTTVVNKRRSARPHFDLDFASTNPMIPVLTNNGPLQIEVRAVPPPPPPPHHRRTASQSSIANSRRAMGRRRMSAVWEEDEGGVGDEIAPPNSPRRVHTDPVSLASLNRARSLSSASQQQRPPDRARSPTTSSMLSGVSGSIGSSAVSSVFTNGSRTVDLPNPLPVTDGGTPSGFTSLVLPRAAYTPSNNRNKRYSLRFGNSSHVDITRSGLAQTTMSTVSITKNAASSVSLGSLRPRFLSLTSLSGSESRTKTATVPKTPSHLLATLPRPLSITSHTPPPSKVNSHQVLVQVYAVALDGLDDRIVSEKAARKDCYGFVPGRAIVGRAVEVGFEVNNVAKSDWVIGLLDVRKCGALAEFVIVEKRRIARCPRPSPSLTLEQLAILPLSGVPAHRAVRSVGVDAETEQDSLHGRALVLQGHDGAGALAVQALAYAGMHVTAHIPLHADPPRTRTPSTSSTSESSSSEPSPTLDEKEDALPPSLPFPPDQLTTTSTREAEERVRRWGARGVRVGDALEVVENCDKGAFDIVIDTVGGKGIWAACQRVLTFGGQFTTLIGDVSSSPLPSPSPLNPVHPSPSPSSSSAHSPFPFHRHEQQQRRRTKSHSHSDAAGGKAVPSIHAHIRANFRSIRHAFKMRKSIGYALVSPAADVDQCGEDVRDSLVEVVRRATAGVFVPFVGDLGSVSEKAKEAGIQVQDVIPRRKGRVVPFERAPELFGSGALSEGRTAVVRVVD